MKKYNLILFLLALTCSQPAYGGKLWDQLKNRVKNSKKSTISSKTKSFIKTGLGFIPGGGVASTVLDQFTGGTQDEKLDGIFDGVVEVSNELMDLKKMTELAYYREMQSRKRAQELKEDWIKADIRKLYGASLEGTLGVSINPADYLPDLNQNTSQLKKNIDLAIDPERKLVKEHGFYLPGTRGALARSNPDLAQKDHIKFEAELRKAERQEKDFEEASRASAWAMIKELNGEIKRLEKENEAYAKNLGKPGQTQEQAIQTKQAINNNKAQIISWKKLSHDIMDGIVKKGLSQEDELKLDMVEAKQKGKTVFDALRKDRDRIRTDYRHLSLLPY